MNVILGAAGLLAIVVLAGRVVGARERATGSGRAPERASRVLSEAEWKDVLLASRADPSSAAGAVITLVEFVDVECPFCARHFEVLRAVRDSLGDRIQVRFAHFPLPQHRFADRGAQAVECGFSQQRGERLLGILLQAQDSLGLLEWTALASRAGIADTAAFGRCLRGPPSAGIQAGIDVGRRIAVSGTPTVVIDGEVLGRPPDLAEIRRRLSAAER